MRVSPDCGGPAQYLPLAQTPAVAPVLPLACCAVAGSGPGAAAITRLGACRATALFKTPPSKITEKSHGACLNKCA